MDRPRAFSRQPYIYLPSTNIFVSVVQGAGLMDLASDLYQLSNKPNTKNDATPQVPLFFITLKPRVE